MNRYLFIICLLGNIVLVRYLHIQESDLAVVIAIFGTLILVFIRRSYLNLKPWWKAGIKDIPKYFKKR